eukprot:TRINITY_DN18926_c0_g1_i2.p5 TRINITY_DN18926_c0_g1~~TRINITY_DN18926_c0_g1_i2.p5  ORF type:complete len:206 (-),score=-9.57 TRINITY_DN18926_c0_g1_i2:417-1034(-)
MLQFLVLIIYPIELYSLVGRRYNYIVIGSFILVALQNQICIYIYIKNGDHIIQYIKFSNCFLLRLFEVFAIQILKIFAFVRIQILILYKIVSVEFCFRTLIDLLLKNFFLNIDRSCVKSFKRYIKPRNSVLCIQYILNLKHFWRCDIYCSKNYLYKRLALYFYVVAHFSRQIKDTIVFLLLVTFQRLNNNLNKRGIKVIIEDIQK